MHDQICRQAQIMGWSYKRLSRLQSSKYGKTFGGNIKPCSSIQKANCPKVKWGWGGNVVDDQFK